MKEFAAKLKEYLKLNKDSFYQEDPWQGDTESGFYTEYHFDMDRLWAEIDEFCESFNKEEV